MDEAVAGSESRGSQQQATSCQSARDRAKPRGRGGAPSRKRPSRSRGGGVVHRVRDTDAAPSPSSPGLPPGLAAKYVCLTRSMAIPPWRLALLGPSERALGRAAGSRGCWRRRAPGAGAGRRGAVPRGVQRVGVRAGAASGGAQLGFTGVTVTDSPRVQTNRCPCCSANNVHITGARVWVDVANSSTCPTISVRPRYKPDQFSFRKKNFSRRRFAEPKGRGDALVPVGRRRTFFFF
jgi:hypothetical protein